MAHCYIWTIGCQMNRADSEQLATSLERLGYRLTQAIEEADLVVLNSCVVRQSAENRVIHKLSTLRELKAHRPATVVALAGCMVDSETSELIRRFPHVDLFLKPGEFNELLSLARVQAPAQHASFTDSRQFPCAFITVIEGCDNFCSYCIVPHRRGREKSHPIAEVRCWVENLVKRGVKEVILLGQNVDSYGHDLPGKPDLADLLHELNSIDGVERIRFLTSHPKDMSQKLIQAVASLKKVCEHISLPVQAGDDDILQAMGRGYTIKYYRELVRRIRSAVPYVALSTDVIVGFPGETDEQYQRTLALLSELRFDTVHVAAYSPRPGTLASKRFMDDIPLLEKRGRLQKVEKLQANIASEVNAQLLGHILEVLVEGKKKSKWHGRTRTGKLVFFENDADCLGQLVNVEIKRTSPWALQGILRQAK